MFPVHMSYQPNETDPILDVEVYSTHSTHDSEGTLIDVYMLAWCESKSMWVTAPVWCFKPLKNKLLKEG